MPERTQIQAGEVPDQPFLHKLIRESRGVATEQKKRVAHLSITLDGVIKVINKQPYDEETKQALVKRASTCPQGALPKFLSSIATHVSAVQRERRGIRPDIKPVISQRRQQKLQELEEMKLRKIKEVDESEMRRPEPRRSEPRRSVSSDFFADDDEQIKTVRQVELEKKIEPKQPEIERPVQQPSREEVVQQMEARRLFAQRLQEESTADEEWLR